MIESIVASEKSRGQENWSVLVNTWTSLFIFSMEYKSIGVTNLRRFFLILDMS